MSRRGPKPCGFGKKSIQKFAEYTAEKLEYTADFDLSLFLKKIGITVEKRDIWDLSQKDYGSLEISADKKMKIFIPLDSSEERNNFTIAHEVGHYMLHYLLDIFNGNAEEGEFFASRYGSGPEEKEANWFAAAFLMPSSHFKMKFNELNNNLLETAKYFKVSTMAAEVRVSELGLNNK